MESQLTPIFEQAKMASRELALLSDERKNDLLLSLADAILTHQVEILSDNA